MVWILIGVATAAIIGAIALGIYPRYVRIEGPPEKKKLSAADGMTAVATVPEPEGLPEPTNEIIFVANSTELIDYDCGHEGPVDFDYDIFGERVDTDTDKLREEHDRCPECIVVEMREIIIRCVLCGHAILPGSPVAVYAGGKGMRKKIAVRAPDGGYIGCMRWDCCPSGGFFAGHWTGKDFRPAFEHGSAAAETFATGEVVSGNIGPINDE